MLFRGDFVRIFYGFPYVWLMVQKMGTVEEVGGVVTSASSTRYHIAGCTVCTWYSTNKIYNQEDCSLNYSVLIEMPICRSLKHISSVSYFSALGTICWQRQKHFSEHLAVRKKYISIIWHAAVITASA